MYARRHELRCFRQGLRGFAAIAAVLALWLGADVPEAAAQQPPAVVSVDQVRMEATAQTVPVIGRLVARRAGDVAARTAGPVAELHVEVGDRVETGDPLAVLDRVRLRAERDRLAAVVNQAQAQVERLTAQAALRRQELSRLEGLRDSAAFGQGRYDDARQEVIIAESAIGTAEATRVSAAASLSLAQIDLSWATIEAPYPGVVTTVHTEVGAWLAVGQPVVSMINDLDLEVEADVPSSRVAALTDGTAVALALDDGSEHTAVVRTVVPAENALTRTRQVRFTPRFGPVSKPLAINQSATVMVPTGAGREVLTVHKDAIVRNQGQAFVYVASDGTAQIRPVQLGAAVGGRFEVLGGLGPGEPVVVRGNERLRPGQAITVGGAG
ncbi:MAG: efflux RND transporter periplasmic adaptor subunit [Rhodospirillales bacterium]|nr:efflux RND transporter periplasmic adaptor subunit [Rhodospirillales bacterium]